MDKDTAGQGEHLSLILQATERRGEYQAVIVTLEFRAVIMSLSVAHLLSEALVGYERGPVQISKLKIWQMYE